MENKENKKFFWKIARHHFFIFFILLIFTLSWGSFLFYKNFMLIREIGPSPAFSKSLLDKKIYQEAVKRIERKNIDLKKVEGKTYLNPFEKATSTDKEA